MICGSNYLLKSASNRRVPKDNPHICKEYENMVYGTVALIGGVASVVKNAKKRTKELMDVNSWGRKNRGDSAFSKELYIDGGF